MSKLHMPFKDPYTYPNHSGIDFPQNEWTNIYASGPGTINYSGYLNERAGYGITMSYDQYPGVEFMYAHHPKNGKRPAARSRVEYGTFIGVVGQTGSRVTGPHVHLEVTIGKGAHDDDGVWLYFDKTRYIGDGATSDTGKPIVEEMDDDMKIFSTTPDGSFYFATSRGLVGIRNPEELGLLRDFLNSKPNKEPQYNAAQRDVINYYLTAPALSWSDFNS